MVDKLVEGSIETAIEMIVRAGAGTGLEKGHFPEIMVAIELGVKAIVGTGQDLGQVQIETEFNVISVGNMVILQKNVTFLGKKKGKEQL